MLPIYCTTVVESDKVGPVNQITTSVPWRVALQLLVLKSVLEWTFFGDIQIQCANVTNNHSLIWCRKIFNVFPIYCTTVVESDKVGPVNQITTSVPWGVSLQLLVLKSISNPSGMDIFVTCLCFFIFLCSARISYWMCKSYCLIRYLSFSVKIVKFSFLKLLVYVNDVNWIVCQQFINLRLIFESLLSETKKRNYFALTSNFLLPSL